MTQTRCKICKKEISVYVGELPGMTTGEQQAALDYADRLLPLATCNPCYDLRNRFKTAEGKIFEACNRILRINNHETREQCRVIISQSLRIYGECLAIYRKKETYGYDDATVNFFVEQPNRVVELIRAYRANATNL